MSALSKVLGKDALDVTADEPDMSDDSSGKDEAVAAKAVLKAITSGSPDRLASALKSFIDICGGY